TGILDSLPCDRRFISAFCRRQRGSRERRDPDLASEAGCLNNTSFVRFVLLSQYRRRYFELEDLIRPFVNAAYPHVHQVPARAIERGPTAAAVDLHGAVCGVPSGIGGEQLCLCSE